MKLFRLPWLLVKIPLVAAVSCLLLILLALAAIQIVFSPERCASLIQEYAPQYIDGRVEVRDARVSVFSHFPAVSADLENVAVICDADGGPADTLASFDRFTAAINVLDLARGVINIKKLELLRPRLSVYRFSDGTSNLDKLKFKLDSSQQDEDTLAVLPPIVVRKVRVAEGVHLVYADEKDTLKTSLRLQNFSFDGRIRSDGPMESRGNLKVDSLLIYGYHGSDSLLFHVHHFYADGSRGDFAVDAAVKAFSATYAFGRIFIPFEMKGNFGVMEDENKQMTVSCRDVRMELATIGAEMDMDFRPADRMALEGSLRIPDLDLQKLLGKYASNFFSEAAKFKTDAHISLGIDVDGEYDTDTGELPAFKLSVDAGRFSISHPDIPVKPVMELHAKADAAQGGPVHAEINRFSFSFSGFDFNSSCDIADMLGSKPGVDGNAALSVDMDSFDPELERMLGMDVSGRMHADFKGSVNPADFNIYNPRTYNVKGSASLENINAKSPDETLDIYLDTMKLKLAVTESKGLGVIVGMDSLRFRYSDSLNLNGKDVKLLVHSSSSLHKTDSGKVYRPLDLIVSMGRLRMDGADSVSLRLVDSKNMARLYPDKNDSGVPVITIKSLNSIILARSGANRVFLKNMNFNADANMSGLKRRARRRLHSGGRRLDSTSFTPRRWMEEADFRKADIHLDLGGAFREVYSKWNVRGTLELERGGVATPAFPLRTALSGFRGSISNNKLAIDTLHIVSGASDVYAKGSLSNLRSVIMRNGTMKLDVDVCTDSLALTEMLAAYAAGQKNMQTDLAYLAELDDAAFENEVVSEPLDTAAVSGVLLVVPANLDADIRLHGKGIQYSKLDITDMDVNLLMKHRCLRMSGLKAVTTVGNLYADAFYSTLSKEDIYAGYNVEFENIDVGDVIDIVPDIDSIMPLLKSFDGKVNCFLAATSQIDTNMNIIFPTMEGVARVTGTDLHFNDCKEIRRLGRLLLFKNPRRATVDTLLMEGLLKDNSLEIFPFLLKIDRWTLAVAGIQNIDQSFSYHVSLAKTPLLIKLGANITGEDFDHAKFRLGRARYRNAKSIPSFTTLIDTTRMNLVESINNVFERGVKRAVADNEQRRRLIEKIRRESGYAQSAAMDSMEVLSSKEQMEIDSLSALPDTLNVLQVKQN